MKQLDTYLDLCTQVYELSKPSPPKAAYEFYRAYVAQADGPILEPMCGTGRFLLPLIQEGYNVQGFDASPQMLGVLHAKAVDQNLKPTVWQGFVEDLNLEDKFKLIFIPSGSFGVITDCEAAEAALHTFYKHLTHDGILLFEIEMLNSSSEKANKWSESIWFRPDGKRIRLRSLEHESQDNVDTVTCKYELLEDNQVVRTEVEEMKIRRHTSFLGMVETLKQVGFRNIRALKAFDATKEPDLGDGVVVYECRI